MDKLLKLRELRGEKLDKMQAILAGAGEQPNEEDAKSFETYEAEIDALDKDIKRYESLERLKASEALPVTPRIEMPDPDKGVKGAVFAKITRALAAGKGNVSSALAVATSMFGENHPATKALAAGLGSAGGFLVPNHYSGEVIDLLRPIAQVRKAGPILMPMQGNIQVPRLNAGSTASYVGENTDVVASQPTFGMIHLNSRKLAAVVPISNDLLRNSSPAADTVVLNDIVRGMANAEDAAFLRSDGSSNTPKGMSHWANPANITSSAGTTDANIDTDIRFCLASLLNNNVLMTNPAWFMSPRTRLFLEFLRNPTTEQLVYPEVSLKHQLKGYNIFETNNIPNNLGGGTATELTLADMADAVLAEEQGIELLLSDSASYYNGSTLVSAFSQDQTVIRAIAKHDFCLRHDRSVSQVTGITWGA